MILTLTLFIVGFIILVYGANLLVAGASSIGKHFHLSDLVIGLTIVALGTSTPELIISAISSANGSSQIAISNVLGSNIFNIYMIIGITAIIYPITSTHSLIKKDLPFCAFASLLLVFCVYNNTFISHTSPMISNIEGVVFLVLFSFYVVNSIKNGKEHITKTPSDIQQMSGKKSLLYIGIGITGLYFGGAWIVDGAIFIAGKMNLSESIIGLTVISFGTSLPELTTSVIAARKKQTDMAIGNAVGSSIFNILLILGVSSLINPLPFDAALNRDLIMATLTTFFLLFFLWTGKGKVINRLEGSILVFIYLVYITYTVLYR